MVSGSKKQGKSSKKEKMVFAKDKNQVIAMVITAVLFASTTLYSIANYVKEQMPPPKSATVESQKLNDDPMNPEGQQASQNQDLNKIPDKVEDANQVKPEQQPPVQQPPAQQQAVQPQPAPGVNPIIPVASLLFIVLLISGIYFGTKYYLSQKQDTAEKPAGRLKSTAEGQSKFSFPKDKNQLIIAGSLILVGLFAFIFLITALLNQKSANLANNSGLSKAEQEMAQQQQQNLQSLNNPNQDNNQNQDLATDTNNIYSQTMDLQHPNQGPNAQNLPQNAQGGEDVDIISRKAGGANVFKNKGKMVMVSVSDSGRSNPFLPAAENVVPSSTLSYLAPPPENLQTSSDASKIITTKISGILYDKYNPSAIINIEGSDYLVKRGDIINHYKVLSISPTQVLVQLGRNVYKAGVGEILADTGMNHNVIANLNKKFGGNDVPIRVKKKKKG